MSEISQFWWDWWVNLGLAVATLLVVVAALFGERFRSWVFGPKLRLDLLSARGEEATVRLKWLDSETGQESSRDEDARYYHLRVRNIAVGRWPVASNVQVYLLRVDIPGPDGVFRPHWKGMAPMRWRHWEINPALGRSIGTEVHCDLCSVVEGKWMELHPALIPYKLQYKYTGETRLRMLLQAKGVEVDSPSLLIEISWNGKWADGEKEMAANMVVKDVTSEYQKDQSG